MEALTRFSPDALPVLRGFAERAISPQFAHRLAAAMHSKLVMALEPETFRALYDDVARAQSVDDLAAESRTLLRRALAEVEGRAWTTTQEAQHPRGGHGRFAAKPGGGAAAAVEETAGSLEQVVVKLMATAKAREREVSPVLKEIASATGGKLEGFQYRLKTRESIHSKIRRDKAQMPGATEEQIASAISDTLRYTSVVDADNHTSGVRATIAALEQRGYKVHKMKNYWQPGDAYNGINAQFVHPESGFRFELQFHTPESWETKERVHLIYEHFRESDSPQERLMLYDQMVKASDRGQRPDGILEVGTLSQLDYAPPGYTPPQTATEAA